MSAPMPERELRDAVGEGLVHPDCDTPWSEMPEQTREVYRRWGDETRARLASLGLEIVQRDEGKE